MIKEWFQYCKDCAEEFGYSDVSYQSDCQRGHSRPERCPFHRELHAREIAAIASSHVTLVPRSGPPPILGNPFIGALVRDERLLRSEERGPAPVRMDIGITDDNIREIYSALEECQLLVLVGPTGSGKSTYVPYRLLYPLPPYDLRHFTRHGPVLVTQPRIQATRSVPDTISRYLVGCSVGPGFEIGFRHGDGQGRKNDGECFDSRNRLIFVTDGSLINWLADEKAGRYSIIMIDEAHERSCNIDLILNLLKRELIKHPHLRLIIASATIDSEQFVRFYSDSTTVRLLNFEGRRTHGYDVHWYDGPRIKDPVPAVARTILDLLARTDSGGILGFLPGKEEIEAAAKQVREGIRGRRDVRVFPLYAALGVQRGREALAPLSDVRLGGRTVESRRVVIATNIAETSLTVPDVVYVVDSGLIRQTEWNPSTCRQEYVTRCHSKDGCKQRWGRAGRVRHGEVFTLYTREQFNAFADHTTPEIERSCLDQTLLAAHVAGVRDPATMPWLAHPPVPELRRSAGVIRSRGLADDDGDLTEQGLELYRLAQMVSRHLDRYDFNSTNRSLDVASLLVLADRFGCLIEAATVLALAPRMGDSLYWRQDGLLVWQRDWDLASKDRISQIHQSLRSGCTDDLDFALKLYAVAEAGQVSMERNFMNADTFALMAEARSALLESFSSGRRAVDERPIDFRLLARLRLVFPLAWPDRRCKIRKGEPLLFEMNDGTTRGIVSRHCAGAWESDDHAVIAVMSRSHRFLNGTFTDVPAATFICRVTESSPPRELARLAFIMAAQREDASISEAIHHLFADQRIPVGSRVRLSTAAPECRIESVIELGETFTPSTGEREVVAELEEEATLDLYEHGFPAAGNLSASHFVASGQLPSGRGDAGPLTVGRWGEAGPGAVIRRRSGSRLDSLAVVVGWEAAGAAVVPVVAADLPASRARVPDDLQVGARIRVRVVSQIHEEDGTLVGFVVESSDGRTFTLPTSAFSIQSVHPGLGTLLGRETDFFHVGRSHDGWPTLSRVPLLEDDFEELVRIGKCHGQVSRISRDRNGNDWVHVGIERAPDVIHHVRLRLTDVREDCPAQLECGARVLLSIQRFTPQDGWWSVEEPQLDVNPREHALLRQFGIEHRARELRCSRPPSFLKLVEIEQAISRLAPVLRRLYETTHRLHGRIHEAGSAVVRYDEFIRRATAALARVRTADARQTKTVLTDLQTELGASGLSSFARQSVRSIIERAWDVRKLALLEQRIAHEESEIHKLQGWIETAPASKAELYRGFVEEHTAKLVSARADLKAELHRQGTTILEE